MSEVRKAESTTFEGGQAVNQWMTEKKTRVIGESSYLQVDLFQFIHHFGNVVPSPTPSSSLISSKSLLSSFRSIRKQARTASP